MQQSLNIQDYLHRQTHLPTELQMLLVIAVTKPARQVVWSMGGIIPKLIFCKDRPTDRQTGAPVKVPPVLKNNKNWEEWNSGQLTPQINTE